MTPTANRIAENLAAIRDAIASAAVRSGRTADAVRLVAVTKYVGPDLIRPLIDAGCHDLGESRPQALWDKAAALASLPIQWHLVGHLQRNKIRRTLPIISLIHSVDSPRLVEAIEAESAPLARRTAVLLEINTSGDAAKHGVPPDQAESLLALAAQKPHLEVRGLMTMARLDADPAAAQADFARLRQLRDRLQKTAPPTVRLNELSMGMSNDYLQAIQEGATLVRIGSALFEGLQPS
jgi:pyridoxal phosphate enzyme (YggS family)